MPESTAKAVTSKAEAEQRVVALIMSRAGEDRAYRRAMKTARAGAQRDEKAPPAYIAGAMLARAIAKRWLASDNVSALAFAFTGQTDPSLRHGGGITLKTPKGGKR